MTDPGTLDAIETPAAVVDVGRMRANLSRVAEYCRGHGLQWRPHAKTHKTPELAAEQVAAGAVGVTVATPAEAEVLSAAVDDILLAYPPIGDGKVRRLMQLSPGVRLTVGLDSREALEGLRAGAVAAHREIGVMVEIDAGMHRVGLQTPEQAVELARAAADAHPLRYRGLLFYPGHVRGDIRGQSAPLEELNRTLRPFLQALRVAGLPPEVVSGGSTPTLWRSHEVEGLTEIRPGTNIFNDRTTALIGACEWEECAYSVLATVVSTSVPGQAVIDAGAKALAKEELRGEGLGYGALLDRPEVVVKGMSEEHGLLDLSETEWRPKVGDRVRVVPNHVCVSVNLHEVLWGVDEAGDVVERWQVAGRRRLALA